MGLPFTIVQGPIFIVDQNGNIADVVTNVATKNRLAVDASIRGANDTSGSGDYLNADVILKNNRNALVTDATVTVEQIFGQDGFADTWFWIDEAGAIGDTVRVQIAGYTDPTSPYERSVPAIDVTYTLVASDVGEENQLRDHLIQALNANLDFQAHWKASVAVKNNPAVHIVSREIGEIGDRVNNGDFVISSTGATVVRLESTDNGTMIRRGKGNSGARDPRDKRLVTIGISGEVQAVPGAAGDLFLQNATDDGTPSPDQGGTGDPDLRVNGSLGSPDLFYIEPDLEEDIFITELRFYGGGNGIQFGNFLSKNNALTNGISVEIRSDEELLNFMPLRVTEDFKNKWALGSGANFRLDIVSGTDQFLAVLIFESPFPLRKQGTFQSGDDYIHVLIQDNLGSGLDELEFLAFGFKREV